MMILRALVVLLVVSGALAGNLATLRSAPPSRCTMSPGSSMILLRVARETTLAFVPTETRAMSSSSMPGGGWDSLLATPGTQMPAARVSLVRMDSATRAALSEAGVGNDQRAAFIRAAPFRADCRPVRWLHDTGWVTEGDTGYARAYLTSRESWVGGVPVFAVTHTWLYPYPRQRKPEFRGQPEARLAPAEAVYTLDSALSVGPLDERASAGSDRIRRNRALAWLRRHRSVAELEPVRSTVRTAILEADWQEAQRNASRLRGSYTVTMESGDVRGVWHFRTHDRPGYSWAGARVPTNQDLLAVPHVAGYLLVGYAASAREGLPGKTAVRQDDVRRVWLAAEDRPTHPHNDKRRLLRGRLEFQLNAAPATLWDLLQPFIPAEDPRDSLWTTRAPPEERQPALPITLRLDKRGGVTSDTMFERNGRRLRVRLERVDTLSIARTW